MREYRSEFCPEHGVWILKRVRCEVSEEAQTTRFVPDASAAERGRLRVVQGEHTARS